ncbi:hypothetical protein K501DRAFT_333894 [Backusella circina FSU 941]|nr:hypothetical protein K501DRAFT_333894 [Backusella circina FSU 941]
MCYQLAGIYSYPAAFGASHYCLVSIPVFYCQKHTGVPPNPVNFGNSHCSVVSYRSVHLRHFLLFRFPTAITGSLTQTVVIERVAPTNLPATTDGYLTGYRLCSNKGQCEFDSPPAQSMKDVDADYVAGPK